MMIFGFALTSIVSGRLLDPFSFDRLLAVSLGVSALTLLLSGLSMWGLERRMLGERDKPQAQDLGSGLVASGADQTLNVHEDAKRSLNKERKDSKAGFKQALALLWRDDQARLFTFFVFTSMLAYSAQDLVLEPFAGFIYHYTPGQTTQLSGLLHAAVLMGMLLLALIGSDWVKGRWGRVSTWMVLGCLLSSLGMLGLCAAGVLAGGAALVPLQPVLWVLGLGNGLFSIAAISTMMRLATQPSQSFSSKDAHTPSVRPGLRMGLWGGAQAVAFGLGGLLGSGASDLARHWMGNPSMAYASVFALEATLFLCSATIAWQVKNLNRSLGDSQSVDSSHQTHSGPRSVRVGMPANFSACSNQNFKVI
jgi:BCD family chlorophyll transporter-like MFS transporter